MFVLADGMGGTSDGDRASTAVVEGIASRADQLYDLLAEGEPARDRRHRVRVQDFLRQIVGQINADLYEKGGGDMGTTCEFVVLSEDSGFVAHVGDSRTYLLREDQSYQLTEDHTFAEQLRRQRDEAGVDSLEKVGEDFEHVLTRSVGGEPEIDIDTLFVDVQPGDRFVLCTDGVSDVLRADHLQDSVRAGGLEESADRLVERALQAGSSDNVTAVVTAVSETAEGERFEGESPVDTFRKVSFLEEIDLFRDLGERDLMKILRIVYKRRFGDGETIIRRNDEAGEMFMLLEGNVMLEIEGHEVARLGPGAHFGEMALFGAQPRSANAIADGDVVLLAVPSNQFRRLVESEDVQLGNKLLQNLLQHAATRIRETTLELLESRSTAEEKSQAIGTAHTLEMEATEGGDASAEE